MQRRNINTRTAYVEARNEAERIKREAKKQTWENLGDELERDIQGTRKLIYSIARNYRKREEPTARTIKDKEGVLLTEQEEIDERWREYFSELLGTTEEPQIQELGEEEGITEETINENSISREEIKLALKEMKKGKSPGVDELPAELLSAGDDMIDWIHRLFSQVWKEGKVPEEWGKAIICPIYKKDDRSECKNYRGISLLSHTGKVYERILERRLRNSIEDILEECQCGFRSNRGVIDLIFTMKMIMEKSWEWARDLYIVFIDLEKAFDTVPRVKLWEALRDPVYRVPPPLIRAIISMYQNCSSAVRSQGSEKWFSVDTGVRQGGVLSPILFIIYMDRVVKRINVREDEALTLAYADDVALVTRTVTELQEVLNKWNSELEDTGMKINKRKTEVMMVSRQRDEIELRLGDTVLELVDNFKYLGVMINEKCSMEFEINNRIAKFSQNVGLMYPLFKEKHISTRVKILIYKSILRPLLVYGCECWVLTTKLKSKVQAAEMRILRLIKGVTRRDRLRNDDIREELDVEPILHFVERAQLRWYGHVMRMEENRGPLKYYKWNPAGKRPVGRPRKRWKDGIREAVAARGETLDHVEETELFADRGEWRTFTRHHD